MTEIVYDLLYMLPMCLFGVTFAEDYIDMPRVGAGMWILTVTAAILISLFFHSKNKIRFLYAGIFIAVMAGLVITKSPEKRMDFIYDNLWFAELFGLAIVCETVGFAAKRSNRIKAIITLSFAVTAAVFLVNDFEIRKTSLALAFLQIMIFTADYIQAGWAKSGDTEPKKHLVCVAPFLMAISFLVAVIPAKEQPYEWKFAVSIWERVTETAKQLSRLFPGEGYGGDYAEIGFSEESELKGEISASQEKVLLANINDLAGDAVYIAGKNFDKYDNLSWTATQTEAVNERIMDIVETRSAVRTFDREHTYDYIRSATVNIKYLTSGSSFLFVPGKAIVYNGVPEEVTFKEYRDSLKGTKRLGYGTEYKVSFDRFNLNQEKYNLFMNNLSLIPEDIWKETLHNTAGKNYEGASYEEYLIYKNSISTVYSENISLSEELRKTLDEIYEGAETEWDKLTALEAWLSSFSYSETPGKIPETVKSAEEFLDYFLLESKKGYCVHYATAFVLLARAEGLPARFVQGFYVKDKGEVTVTSAMAHSWPEVYIENFGWIGFEPTPGYRVKNYWKVSEDYVPVSEMVKPDFRKNEETPENIEEETAEPVKSEFPVKIFVGVLALSLGFAVIFLISYYLIIRRKLKSLATDSISKIYCKTNLYLLTRLGFRMEENETLTEYKVRIAKDFEKTPGALEFIDCFEIMLYSKSEDIEKDFATIKNSEQKILSLIREESKMKLFAERIGLSVYFANIISN